MEMSAENPIDWTRQTVTFDVLPDGIMGTIDVILRTTGGDVVLIAGEPVSGGVDIVKFFTWDSFPSDQEILVRSVNVDFDAGGGTKADLKTSTQKGSKTAKDVRAVGGRGYGRFILTRYFTPRDSSYGDPDADALLDGKAVRVNSVWANAAISPEGRGEFNGSLVTVARSPRNSVASYLLSTTEGGGPVGEGNYRAVLEPLVSIAKHKVIIGRKKNGRPIYRVDKRFNPGEQLLLVGTNPKLHRIDDTGNWGGSDNHFDVFMGRGGPSILDGTEPPDSAYVFKLPKT